MSELLSVSEAAKAVDIPERTFRRWVASGRIASEPDPLGVRGRVLHAEVVMQFRDALSGCGQRLATDPPEAGQCQPPPASGRPLTRQRPAGGDDLDVPDREQIQAPELQAPELQALSNRIDAQEDYISHLQAQLEVRAREIERHAVAEEQLRVMLMRLEETNRELAQTLVQKALPPAPEVAETPRRALWWSLWSRR